MGALLFVSFSCPQHLNTALFPISSGTSDRKWLWWVCLAVALCRFPITIPNYNSKLQFQITISKYNSKLQLQVTITDCNYNSKLQFQITIPNYNSKLQLQFQITISSYNYWLQLQIEIYNINENGWSLKSADLVSDLWRVHNRDLNRPILESIFIFLITEITITSAYNDLQILSSKMSKQT